MDGCSAFKVTIDFLTANVMAYSQFSLLQTLRQHNILNFHPYLLAFLKYIFSFALKIIHSSVLTTTPPNTFFCVLYCFLFHLVVVMMDIPSLRHWTPLFSAWFYLNNCHRFSPHCHADNPQIYISSPDLSPELLPVISVHLPLEISAWISHDHIYQIDLFRFLPMREVCVCVVGSRGELGWGGVLLAFGTTENSNDNNNSYHTLITYDISGTLDLSAHVTLTTTL